MNLSPLRKTDIKVGAPLPWPVYDNRHKLLLREGFVVETARQLDQLMQSGMYRQMLGAGDTASPEEKDKRGAGAQTHIEQQKKMTFAEIGMDIGTPIQLQNSDNPSAAKHFVRLIGYAERKSLLLTHPSEDGQILFIKEGSGFRCSAFHGKNAYTFDASVIKPQLLPYPYLHLEYPAQVFVSMIRKAYRIKTAVVASVGPADSDARCACHIQDMSMSGFMIQSPEDISSLNEKLHVAFRLSIEDEPSVFELDTIVRNYQPHIADSGKTTWRLGVELTGLEKEQRRLLEIYIYRNLLEHI
jgi:hypothetical protein